MITADQLVAHLVSASLRGGGCGRMGYGRRDVERFWARVDVAGPDDCWVWQGGCVTARGGYGLFDRRRDGKRKARQTHRVAYEFIVGPIPDGLMIRHECDNPPCANPAHLLPGTSLDNSQDMVRRGRHWTQVRPERVPRGDDHWTRKRGTSALPHGEDHHQGKMTWAKVRAMRIDYAKGGVSQRELAARFDVSQGLVWQIVNGRMWKESPPAG
jgi:hypothetical protein